MLNAPSFYEPLIEWVANLESVPVQFTIELDYFNTSSSKKLLELLNIIDGKNNIQEFIVYWAFESDDDDILIKGQILADRMKNAKFRFKEIAGV